MPWLAGWRMGEAGVWPCPCEAGVSVFPAGHRLSVLSQVLPWYLSIRGQWSSEWKTSWGWPCVTVFLGQGWTEGTQPVSGALGGQLVSTTLGSVQFCPCCLSPGTWARAPAPDVGWRLQERRRCPGKALRNDGPGVGTAVTPSCPPSAPGHRRSSRGHILSSHPHLCPMRTGAPWPWVCSPVGSPLSQPFLRRDASPRGWGAGVASFPPWWRLWHMGALGTGQPGQPCQCLSDGITGREKWPYVLTQKVSTKDLHFSF